jgi:hypothetical protein
MANLALKHYGEGFNGSMTSKGHGLYSQKQIALQFSYSIHLPLPVWSRFMGKDQKIVGPRRRFTELERDTVARAHYRLLE